MRQKIKDKWKEGWNVTAIFSDITQIRQSMPLFLYIFICLLFYWKWQIYKSVHVHFCCFIVGRVIFGKGNACIKVMTWVAEN